MISPLVSISCITYNHAPYIRQCLDGFLMQQCNFEFEVLIHDDASTDGTQEIIKEYVDKYPEIIKPIFQTQNQYSQGVRGMNAKYNFPRAKGKYIALCEGDDYWIDPLKLQKQVDFLEDNRDCTLLFSNCKVIKVDDMPRGLKVVKDNRYYSGEEILRTWTIPTASVLFRYNAYQNIKINNDPDLLYWDIYFFLSLAEFGKIYGQKDTMVCYRRHDQGTLIMSEKNENFVRKFTKHHLFLSKQFGGKYKNINYEFIANTFLKFSLKNKDIRSLLKYNNYVYLRNKRIFFSWLNIKINIKIFFRIL